MTLYEELIAAGCQVEGHNSDLRVKATPESKRIVDAHCGIGRLFKASIFPCQITGEAWYEIAFAFDPFWETAC